MAQDYFTTEEINALRELAQEKINRPNKKEEVSYVRRSGKTTRMIDSIVQELFNKGEVYLPTSQGVESALKELPFDSTVFIDPDHRAGNMAQYDLTMRVLKRLETEHERQFQVKKTTPYTLITLKR